MYQSNASTKKGLQAKKTQMGQRQAHYHVKFAVYNEHTYSLSVAIYQIP